MYHNQPCAASGLISYRYNGQYGYIMIGAKNTEEALKEAKRSLYHTNNLTLENLEIWNGQKYIKV